jgi:hypothetical protein
MISANFSVEGSSAVQAHVVAYGATVDFEILSLTGVETIEWSIIGTSKASQSAPTITPAGSPSGATATVTMPSDPGDGLGRGFIMKALVRAPGGADTQVAFRVFGAANAGGVIPVVANEENYRSLTHGWIDEFNQAMAQAGIQFGTGTEVGEKPQWNGSIWAKRRGFINPDIDLTGTVDATATINTLCGAGQRRGACIEIPDGRIRIDGNLTVTAGITLTGGPRRGIRSGFRTFNVGYEQVGPTLYAYSTSGSLISLQQQASVHDLEVYYPNQSTTGAPTAYGWTIEIGANNHGCTVENITCTNPYQFLYVHEANGTKISDIWAFPRLIGMQFGRCADVVRVSNVHFNGATDYAATSGLFDWVQANGFAFIVDGAEEINFTDCFAIGYLRGLRFRDMDADSFRGVYGSWKGGGLDRCAICVRVDSIGMLTARGFKISDCALIPAVTGGAGIGIEMADTVTPSQMDHWPAIFCSNVSFSGSTYDTAVNIASGSHGVVTLLGGSIQQQTNQGVRNASATGILSMNMVAMATGATRSANTGGGTLNDVTPITI